MRVLFLNQYFPPDPAPTGILLREVADALEKAGVEVVFASSGQEYRGGQGKGGRLKREVRGLWQLFMASLNAGAVDVVVSGTSPPLLVVVGAVVAKLRGARHYHWLFDMYPELAMALGEIPDGAPARLFAALAGWAYRSAKGVVGLDADMASRLGKLGVTARVIPPWVPEPLLKARAAEIGEPPAPDSQEPVWLYSGNLGRAHEWQTLLDAQKFLETAGPRWRLVFQGGGPSRAAAEGYAAKIGLCRCEWRSYVPEERLPASLLAANVLVVTQKPEAQGLLWPSKLALVTSLPRPILWVGPVEGAIGRDLAGLPQAGRFAPGDANGIAKWLTEKALTLKCEVRDPVAGRNAGLREWREMLG